MDVPHEAVLLRIFTGADDRYGVEEPLYRAIVAKAREMHLAGATVLKGPVGYGQSSRMHKPHFFGKDDRPIVIEILRLRGEDQRVSAHPGRDDGERAGHARESACDLIRQEALGISGAPEEEHARPSPQRRDKGARTSQLGGLRLRHRGNQASFDRDGRNIAYGELSPLSRSRKSLFQRVLRCAVHLALFVREILTASPSCRSGSRAARLVQNIEPAKKSRSLSPLERPCAGRSPGSCPVIYPSPKPS